MALSIGEDSEEWERVANRKAQKVRRHGGLPSNSDPRPMAEGRPREREAMDVVVGVPAGDTTCCAERASDRRCTGPQA